MVLHLNKASTTLHNTGRIMKQEILFDIADTITIRLV